MGPTVDVCLPRHHSRTGGDSTQILSVSSQERGSSHVHLYIYVFGIWSDPFFKVLQRRMPAISEVFAVALRNSDSGKTQFLVDSRLENTPLV